MRSINSLSYKLDDFRLERLLGGGAFADAYEVTHIKSGRVLALKCIHKNRMSHESLKYAYNEKELLAKLQHPNLIKFYCCFQNKGYLFLILELCPNGTLRDLLKRPTQLPESYIRLLVAELVEVLGFLHDNCVIYRDLKPENIGIDSEGHLKLLDLGLSKEARRSNSICGSYHYLAPEMVSGGEHSFGLDWYMLGITIYELITGTTPFKGKTPSELLKRISE
jgi:serine/threonine protein kinase